MVAALIWVWQMLWGVLDVVITGFVDGDEPLGVLDVPQVKHEVLGPAHLADELDVVAG